jgi:hypothetical protein
MSQRPEKPEESKGEPAPAPADPRVKHLWPRDRLFRDEDVLVRLDSEVEAILGPSGRLLSGSKSGYRRRHPDHEVHFNACLFGDDGTQLWFGDIDLTIETARLQKLANRLGRRVILTPEWPYRFDGLPAEKEWGPEIRAFDPRERS